MDFEDLLVEVGEYGTYQKKLVYFFLIPASALLPWYFLNTLFMVSVPDHWCYVPELDRWNLTLDQQKLLIRPPDDEKCSMYQLNYTELFESPDWNWTVPENTTTTKCLYGYQYDKIYYDRTASTEWNLVCNDNHYNSMILTLAAVGSIFGTPLYGYLSDKVGRKPTFFLTAVVTLVSGVVSVLMKNFTAFAIMRTINGSIMPSVFQVPFIILLEIVGPTKRTSMNAATNICWTIGLCLLPLIAYLSRDWVLFGLITSSVTVIFFAYWKFLPESPRWLLSQERYEEAADVMYDIDRTNGKNHSREEIFLLLKKLGEKARKEKESGSAGPEASAADLMRYPKLRKHFFILTSLWVACGTAYYGLQINSPNLGGNEFLTFFLLAIVEIPGYVFSWYFMEKWGRRWCSVSTITLTGVILLLPIFDESVGIATSILGKFGASAGFMVMYQQSSELFPTVLRAIGMGLSGTVNCIVTIAVPYVVYLSEYGKFIPFLIIAFVCLIPGIASSFLPETLNEVLPQTVADAENFASHQKFFSCNRRRRPSCYENRPSLSHIHGITSNLETVKSKSEVTKAEEDGRMQKEDISPANGDIRTVSNDRSGENGDAGRPPDGPLEEIEKETADVSEREIKEKPEADAENPTNSEESRL